MGRDQSFHQYVMEGLFRDISDITSRAMFGGWGIYKNGIFFAIIVDGELYFKVGDNNRSDYETYGSRPFVYQQGKKPVTMSYWLLPEEVMDDDNLLEEWIEQSCSVANKSKARKKR